MNKVLTQRSGGTCTLDSSVRRKAAKLKTQDLGANYTHRTARWSHTGQYRQRRRGATTSKMYIHQTVRWCIQDVLENTPDVLPRELHQHKTIDNNTHQMVRCSQRSNFKSQQSTPMASWVYEPDGENILQLAAFSQRLVWRFGLFITLDRPLPHGC